MTTVVIDADIEDLVIIFLSKRREDYKALVTLLKQEKYEKIKEECHRIAGTSLSYGFDEIARLARLMEKAAVEEKGNIIGNALIQYDRYLKEVKYECREE